MPELEELFMPLRAMEYETGTGIRSAVGLYLSREIARVHNGKLVCPAIAKPASGVCDGFAGMSRSAKARSLFAIRF
jgi:hypothetical protein